MIAIFQRAYLFALAMRILFTVSVVIPVRRFLRIFALQDIDAKSGPTSALFLGFVNEKELGTGDIEPVANNYSTAKFSKKLKKCGLIILCKPYTALDL